MMGAGGVNLIFGKQWSPSDNPPPGCALAQPGGGLSEGLHCLPKIRFTPPAPIIDF